MLLHSELYDPAELTGFSREALADQVANQFTLAQFLPDLPVDDLQYRFTAGGEGLQDAATFRSYDAESAIGSRPGTTTVRGELPPMSRKYRLGEYDRLRQRANGGEDASRNIVESDARRGVRAIASRMELARGNALATGKVTIAEDGVAAVVDFGRQANHTTTPATVWSTIATAPVLDNLITWSDRYSDTNGDDAGVIVTRKAVLRLMQRNKQIIDAVKGSAAAATMVTVDELNALITSNGIPAVQAYDAQVSVAGVKTPVIPAGSVLFLPFPMGDDSELGATLWGTTAEALEADYGIEDGKLPGIVAGVYKTADPVALWTKAAAIGLPVLANPNLSLAAAVL